MREPVTISLEDKTIKKIDDSKGKHEPRSRFVEDIILEYFEQISSTVQRKGTKRNQK
ncbi:protein of unknown function [Nitrosotalea devaniterrae]|uniref:Ribbon-helix-helix protein CopG domain-containing protein n=1 Tax=Nitrosotalea devaniterrae TaxID=1078905 RepID=A0A128A374_9ARCH|nr:protein of unknown function [Candidatus Nitrosotalea devanaterra]